jgi:hypothetical protein
VKTSNDTLKFNGREMHLFELKLQFAWVHYDQAVTPVIDWETGRDEVTS